MNASVDVTIKVFLVLIPSSLMISTAVSFLGVRLKKKESQFKSIIQIMGVDLGEATLVTPSVRDEHVPADYILPVLFATLVSLVGFTYIFFAADLLLGAGIKPNLLINPVLVEDTALADAARWRNTLVMTMAFLGSYIWSTRNIIRRLVTIDMTPTIYYSAGMRMIFASFTSLMLALFLSASPLTEPSVEVLPVIAFLAGMVPDRVLVFLFSKFSKIFRPTPEAEAGSLPLEMIQGINEAHKLRLNEVGIDNAQNLAESNIIDLLLKTPFSPLMLINWIAQAKLYIYFPENIGALRLVGLRDIFDYKEACKIAEQIQEIADQAKIPELTIRLVYQQALEDPGIDRLYYFRAQLAAMDGGATAEKNRDRP